MTFIECFLNKGNTSASTIQTPSPNPDLPDSVSVDSCIADSDRIAVGQGRGNKVTTYANPTFSVNETLKLKLCNQVRVSKSDLQ